MYQNMLASNSFFENKPAYFVAYLAPWLKPILVEENEFIYQEGEVANEMYFVLTGEVSICLVKNKVIPYIIIRENYYFGEVDLLFSDVKKRCDTALSNVRTELFTLAREKFEDSLIEYEEIGETVVEIAKQRRERNLEAKATAEKEHLDDLIVRRRSSMPILNGLVSRTFCSGIQTSDSTER
jgi:CRP-like cAMP-binding protein